MYEGGYKVNMLLKSGLCFSAAAAAEADSITCLYPLWMRRLLSEFPGRTLLAIKPRVHNLKVNPVTLCLSTKP
jgi:hypothetical protein